MITAQQAANHAARWRVDVLDMAYEAGSGHLGGSFSCAELLACIYGSMKITPQRPKDPGRDRFVLSKGHAAPMLYAALSHYGFLPREELKTLRKIGSRLQGHPCAGKLPGVDISTGSLGMGTSVGVGMSLAANALGRADQRVFVLCGDGEMQEGSNYEGLMALASRGLDNMTVFIDCNGVQLDGPTARIMPGVDLKCLLGGFSLPIVEIDGHDTEQILRVMDHRGIVIANTVKGKGVSFMEGEAIWHGKPLTPEEYLAARAELEGRLHA